MEWYCRTTLALASSVQVFVAGSHRSAAKTALLRLMRPSPVSYIPPVARTDPSARRVMLCWRLRLFIGAAAVT